MLRFNSLLGRNKFPVLKRRELPRNRLIALCVWGHFLPLGGSDMLNFPVLSQLAGNWRAPRPRPCQAPRPSNTISMRRFWARPRGVSLGAIGCVSPNPFADRMLGSTPCERKYATTFPARRDESSILSAMPACLNSGPTGSLSVNPQTTTLVPFNDLNCSRYWLSAASPAGVSW